MNSLLLVSLLTITPLQDEPSRALLITTRASIATYVLGQFTDGLVSSYGFGSGTLIELNPLLSWAENRPVTFGLIKGSVAVGTAWILAKLHKNHPKAVLITGIILTSVQGYVTYRNYKEMRR